MLAIGSTLLAQSPSYLAASSPQRSAQLRQDRWLDVLAREVPALKRESSGRLPMIMWHGVGFSKLEPSELAVLSERGLSQHLQLSTNLIPAARAIQKAGMPVILMEGRTDSWPYFLAGDTEQWAHQLSPLYPQDWFGKDDAFQWHGACPHRTAGWPLMQKQIETLMKQFKQAGVNVDGVWVDFEGDPYPWPFLYDQIRNCARCRQELPADVVNNENRWKAYSWKQYVGLYDAYFAKAVRNQFPDCLVTNWHVVHSTNTQPMRYFVNDSLLPELSFEHFNATNPIAYASDGVWNTRGHLVDDSDAQAINRFFLIEMLHQVSIDRGNRGNDSTACIPWVGRACKLGGDPLTPTPLMSRPAYREALRHLWLRGCDSMQIFNPMMADHEEAALIEVQDAVSVYDEMLEYKELMQLGDVMNLALPDSSMASVLWSGLRTNDQAVIRVIRVGDAAAEIEIEVWPGVKKRFAVEDQGASYLIHR